MKEQCILYANCQGDPLKELLLSVPEFSDRYLISKYTNFLHENIPYDELRTCSLFLFQNLGPKWGPQSTDELRRHLPRHCHSLALPNMFFKGYWPFWTREQNFDFSDLYLNALLERGLEKKEILYIYLNTDMTRKYDVQAIFEESIAVERAKEKETDIQTVDMVLKDFKEYQSFTTINHPGRKYLFHIADAILSSLGVPGLSEAVKSTFPDPFSDFHLPVHPQVIDFFNLKCFTKEMKYPVYGKSKTFKEYINNYVDCKLLGFDTFIGYLQLV